MYEVENISDIRHKYLKAISWSDEYFTVNVRVVGATKFVAQSYIGGFVIDWEYGPTIHEALTSLYIILQRFYREPDRLKKVLPTKLHKRNEELLQDLIAFVLRASQAMGLEEIKEAKK